MKIIVNRIVVHIPKLNLMLADCVPLLQAKLQPIISDEIVDVKESQTLYLSSSQGSESGFDSIAVDYVRNRITFNQVNREDKELAEAVLKTMTELGIEEFDPLSMSFFMSRSTDVTK